MKCEKKYSDKQAGRNCMNLENKVHSGRQSRNLSIITPSIAGILFLSIFLSQTLPIADGLLKDCDTGYHIRAGEYIINNFSIPKYDIFSFHSPAIPWVAHEWLSEVIMAAIHHFFGLTGIVIFFALLISSVYYILFKRLQSIEGNILISIIVAIFVIASSQMHWLARPHIFSMLFFLVWYCLLDAWQYDNKKILYLQLPLMLLWVNMHGGFIAGFILNGIYLIGNFAAFIYSTEPERFTQKNRLISLALTTGACLVVSLINPYGYKILLFPFKLVTEKFIMNNIAEYLSPNFHLLWAIPFEAFLLFILTLLALSIKRLNWVELLLIIFFLHMSLYSARYIPLFAIVAAPIVAKQFGHVLPYWKGRLSELVAKRAANFSEIDRSAKDFAWPAVVLLIVTLLSLSGRLTHDFDHDKKPIAASKFLEQEHIEGNMFNNDEFGDYIIYRNYPSFKVFFDGRNDMYGVDRFKEYVKVVHFEPGWEKILEKYDITWIVYNSSSALSRFLIHNDGWRLIYADKVASIFLKDIPENQTLIQKYKDVKPFIDESGIDESG
jgi:hypothetical protein